MCVSPVALRGPEPALLQSRAAGWVHSTLPSVQQKQMLLEVLRISEMKEEMPRRMMVDDNNDREMYR